MIDRKSIPEHWGIEKLRDVCDVVTGTTPPTKELENYGNDIPFVKPPQLLNKPIIDAPERLSTKGAKHARLLPIDSVLVTCIGNLGRTAINKSIVAFNQQINAIVPSVRLDGLFLFYQVQSHKFIDQLNKLVAATTVPIVNKSKFESIQIVIPPLSEQLRIVSKIEELFSELDKGKQQLEMVKLQLKTYRQAVLKWAFEGKFTNKDVKDGQLPEGWKSNTLKEITSVLGDGLHGTPKYSSDGEYYFINGNNLNNGKIKINSATKQVSFKEFEKYKKPLNDKTILVSINGTIGNTSFYKGEKVILGKSACYFNVNEGVDKRLIRHFISSQRFIKYANNTATGSTIKNVSLKAMRGLVIPVPCTIKEQEIIVNEIETRLSVCDKIEETINNCLQQSESLRQSVLKQAFEGKLVKPDENYN